ncbi:hypothetical protein ABPG74_009671 [Tetrahymena malaccensis]
MAKQQSIKNKIISKANTPKEKKKEKCYNCSESMKRQFSVFFPFCVVLVLVILIQSLLIQLVYLQPLQTNIEDAIWGKYQQYLQSIAYGDKITIMLSYQRVVTPIQSISLFLKKLVVDKVSLADLANWNPDQTNSYSFRQTQSAQPNFRNVNDFTAADLCPFDAFYNDNKGSKVVQEYKKRQYFGWSNWQQNIWESLTEEQRDYLLYVDTAMSVGKIIYYNQNFEAIQKYSFYSARDSDDTWYGFHPGERLMSSGKLWNTKNFGGPFSCNLQSNGQYLEYQLPKEDYFSGYDYNHQPCSKTSQGTCQCPYYNQNRKFPIVWRCRPWYLASAKNAYITFADAYTDVNTGQLITTCSFKVVTQQVNTIDDENQQPAYMIQSIDLTLGNLQTMYGQGDVNQEYSYLVAPQTFNYDTNVGYYNYTAFYHPLNNGTKQTIIYLEFANSSNKDEEIRQYQAQTAFMLNPNIREDGCSLFSSSSSSGIDNEDSSSSSSSQQQSDSKQGIYIKKNGTTFYTMFSTIKVCYGNLQQQKSLIVGYLARAISEDRKYQLTKTIRNNLQSMQMVIILSLVGCFFIIFTVLFFVLQKFLKYNFEEPISILSEVIMEAGPQEIHQLQNAIEKGQVRTQYELKNLLSAINNVVIGVQKKVQQDLEDNNSNDDEQLQEIIFKDALQTFQTVEHKLGMGMCLNNIGNIYMRKGDYKTALKLYKSAFLLSQEQYKEEIKQNQDDQQHKNNHEFLITDSTKRNFMRIYACRQYQMGCTLLKSAISSMKRYDTVIENQINQIIYEEASANQLLLNDRIVSDEDHNRTENHNLMKSEFSQQIQDANFSQNRNLLLPSIRNIEVKDKESPVIQRRLKNKKSNTEISSQKVATFKNLNAVKQQSEEEIYPKNAIKSNTRKKTLIKINEQHQTAPNQNQEQDEIEIVKRISQGMKNSGYENENVFSDRYYQKVQHKLNNSNENQKNKVLINQEVIFDDKNSYLMQAYDLFFDVKSIFDKLGDYCSQNQYYEAYEYYSLSIINLLKLAQCQLLLGCRNFVVKELLNQAKEQIQLKVKRFQNFYVNTIPQDILLQKYYLLKAQLRISEENYPKCLKNLLQSINFCFDMRSSHESQINQTLERFHFYDPIESLQCVEMLQQLIKREKINLTVQQRLSLEKDYNYLNEQCKKICEPYFFEVFFKDSQQQNAYQIEQPQQ